MTRRVLLVISASIAVFALATAFTASRLVQWHHRGYAGISAYVEPPSTDVKTKKKRRTSMFENGRVMVSMPHSVAAESGIEAGDVIETVNGIPITDRARLQQLDTRVRSGDRVRISSR